ncbi:MAG: hypothetical protein U5K43_07320 [Halofilum sp. (in: g-proteobacteria)]|nr:hypothetical protein [Halofilum sp. (in: g-proteobacteria)]
MKFLDALRKRGGQWIAPVHRRAAITLVAGVASLGGIASHFLGGPVIVTDGLWLSAAAVAGTAIALRALSALRAGSISIELLVTIAAVGAVFIGEYWESAAVTFLFVLGGYLEARTLARTRSALKDLLALAPTEIVVRRADGDVTVAPHEVAAGETVIVRRAGGSASTARSSVAGPRSTRARSRASPYQREQAGDTVFAGTVSQDGYLELRADSVGTDTTLARIIQRVEAAQESRAPTQRLIERFARWYTPAIIALALAAYGHHRRHRPGADAARDRVPGRARHLDADLGDRRHRPGRRAAGF